MYRSESIPFFTKLYLGCAIGFAILVFAKSLDPYAICYTFTNAFLELSLWRPITALLYLGRVSIILPFQVAFAFLATYKFANKVNKTSADLVWLMMLTTIGLMLFSTLISNLYFFGNSFVMVMLMVWALNYPRDTVKIFGITLNSVYFPLLYFGIMVFLGSYYKAYIAGILLGLIFGVMKSETFIRMHGDYFPTPTWLKSYFRFES